MTDLAIASTWRTLLSKTPVAALSVNSIELKVF